MILYYLFMTLSFALQTTVITSQTDENAIVHLSIKWDATQPPFEYSDNTPNNLFARSQEMIFGSAKPLLITEWEAGNTPLLRIFNFNCLPQPLVFSEYMSGEPSFDKMSHSIKARLAQKKDDDSIDLKTCLISADCTKPSCRSENIK